MLAAVVLLLALDVDVLLAQPSFAVSILGGGGEPCAAATRFTMLWRSSISRAMRSSTRSLARRSSSALTSATRLPSRSIVTAFCRRIMDSSMVAMAIDFSVALIMSVSASWSFAWSVARSCSICCAAESFFFGGSGLGETGGRGGGGDAGPAAGAVPPRAICSGFPRTVPP